MDFNYSSGGLFQSEIHKRYARRDRLKAFHDGTDRRCLVHVPYLAIYRLDASCLVHIGYKIFPNRYSTPHIHGNISQIQSGFWEKFLFLHYTSTMSDSAEENPIQTPRGFMFNEEQLKLLQSHIPAIQSADGKKERHKLIKVARKEVMALPASKALPAEKRQELTVAVNSWFARRAKGTKQKIKFGKTWTGRLAMYDEKKEMVNELKARLFEEAKAEGKDPTTAFNFFQKAMTEVWDGLSSAERKHYRTVAIQWNKEGVSKELKQQYVIYFNMATTYLI